MKFLVDAQLPRRLALAMTARGHDAIHTLDLPLANRTSDQHINELSHIEQRIVITKDADFVNSFWLHNTPYKLLLISTGNISNKALETLFSSQLAAIVDAFDQHSFIELNSHTLIIHS